MKNKIIKSLAILFCALTVVAGNMQSIGTMDVIRKTVPNYTTNGDPSTSIDELERPYGQ